VTGAGPVVMLLHGGGRTRRDWHSAGYVDRLSREFRVITVDLRGHGDSDKPAAQSAYAIDTLIGDLLAVADKADAANFSVWGFSYGANIGRYLASRSERVRSMVYIGIPFGPPVDPEFRALVTAQLRDPRTPAVAAAWMSALLEYPAVEPGDMKCPTLWVVGTANAGAFASAQRYKARLGGTPVSLVEFDRLTHPEEMSRIDDVFPKELEFTRAHAR
jgi:pimeloyl-ACP methyl ester carboxylesterase